MFCKAIAPFYYFHQEQVNLTQEYEIANKQLCDTAEAIKGFHDENPCFAEDYTSKLDLGRDGQLIAKKSKLSRTRSIKPTEDSEDKLESHHS